jgi:large subunit ribosomal protein L10
VNREQKAAVIDEIATQIGEAQTVIAVDYRGVSVTQAAELRERLSDAGATFRIVKNTLTERAVDKVGAESLKALLEGPTAFTFVRGDAALAAKALATFRRQNGVLEFKGGTMDGEAISIEQIEAISRLPGRDVLQGQLVGMLASPITGLVRGLGSLISGLAVALGQIQEKGLVGGGEAQAEEAPEAPADEAPEQAPGDPVAEAEAVEAEDAAEDSTEDEATGEDESPPDENKEG